MQFERYVLEPHAGPQASGRDTGHRRRFPGTGAICPCDTEILGALAQHETHDPLLRRSLGHIHDTDRLAFAQDGGAVADRSDLDESMRDEDDAAVRASLAPDDLEDSLGQVGRQGGGHLIEHEDMWLDGERPGQIDDPQGGQRELASHVRQVEIGDAEFGDPVPEWFDGRAGQPQVRSDVKIRDECRFLVYGHDAATPCLGG